MHHEALVKFILEQDLDPQQRRSRPCHVNVIETLPPPSQLSFPVGNFGSGITEYPKSEGTHRDKSLSPTPGPAQEQGVECRLLLELMRLLILLG